MFANPMLSAENLPQTLFCSTTKDQNYTRICFGTIYHFSKYFFIEYV